MRYSVAMKSNLDNENQDEVLIEGMFVTGIKETFDSPAEPAYVVLQSVKLKDKFIDIDTLSEAQIEKFEQQLFDYENEKE